MWVLQQATTNTNVPATCAEKQLLTNPSYIVQFYQNNGHNYKYCVVTDSSSYPDRWQKFTIVLTSTPTSGTNQVDLKLGKWKYYIYEISASDLSSIIDFSAVDYTALNKVDQGNALVQTTPTTMAEYTGQQTTYVSYGS